MATVKVEKKFARISTYGDILIPMGMLEQFVESALVVRTTYENSEDRISEVKSVGSFTIHGENEIEQARVQMALEGTKE